jgi:hypothetical protein
MGSHSRVEGGHPGMKESKRGGTAPRGLEVCLLHLSWPLPCF